MLRPRVVIALAALGLVAAGCGQPPAGGSEDSTAGAISTTTTTEAVRQVPKRDGDPVTPVVSTPSPTSSAPAPDGSTSTTAPGAAGITSTTAATTTAPAPTSSPSTTIAVPELASKTVSATIDGSSTVGLTDVACQIDESVYSATIEGIDTAGWSIDVDLDVLAYMGTGTYTASMAIIADDPAGNPQPAPTAATIGISAGGGTFSTTLGAHSLTVVYGC